MVSSTSSGSSSPSPQPRHKKSVRKEAAEIAERLFSAKVQKEKDRAHKNKVREEAERIAAVWYEEHKAEEEKVGGFDYVHGNGQYEFDRTSSIGNEG